MDKCCIPQPANGYGAIPAILAAIIAYCVYEIVSWVVEAISDGVEWFVRMGIEFHTDVWPVIMTIAWDTLWTVASVAGLVVLFVIAMLAMRGWVAYLKWSLQRQTDRALVDEEPVDFEVITHGSVQSAEAREEMDPVPVLAKRSWMPGWFGRVLQSPQRRVQREVQAQMRAAYRADVDHLLRRMTDAEVAAYVEQMDL